MVFTYHFCSRGPMPTEFRMMRKIELDKILLKVKLKELLEGISFIPFQNFYGTANSNQTLMEIIPSSLMFVSPNST